MQPGHTCATTDPPTRVEARADALSPRTFPVVVVLLCLLYASIEVLYLTRTNFNPDEMQGAYAVHNLKGGRPYGDFAPYKTVLGYYIQLPTLYLAGDGSWDALILLRVELVIINSLALLLASLALARRFRREAVCAGLLMLVTMSNFLERSFEIRVDVLAAWLGLGSLLLLLDRRYIWAGVVCALGFFVSQKGAYYVLASDAALAVWLLARRDRRSLRDALTFNCSMLAVLLVYVAFWATLSSTSSVVEATFLSHYDIAFTELYDYVLRYWRQTLWRNPFFYAIAAVHLMQLAYWRLERPKDYAEAILLVYALALAGLCVWHKQPWPYFFLILIPTAFVVNTSFFHHFAPSLRRGQQFVLLLFLPMALLPLHRFPIAMARDNSYQRQVIEMAEAVMGPDDTYIDGIDILYRRRQAPELRWLDSARLARLNALPEDRLWELVERLDAEPVKLVIGSWRIRKLPPMIRHYLALNYTQWFGNLFLYAPTVGGKRTDFNLKFAGDYLVGAKGGDQVSVDSQTLRAGDRITLGAGRHDVESERTFRLMFLPESKDRANVPYTSERLEFMKFKYKE